MFTIKVFNDTGHFVTECKKYAFVRGEEKSGIALSIDRIECGDHPGEGDDHYIPVGLATIYIMNSNGKTVDKFEPYPPGHPKRLALVPSERPPGYDEQFQKAAGGAAPPTPYSSSDRP